MSEHENLESAFELDSEPMGLADRCQFFVQLSTLFSAGCTLVKSIEAVARTEQRPHLSRVCFSLVHKLEAGLSLSQAMSCEQDSFPRAERGMIRMGEETGRLHFVMERLAKSLEQQLGHRRRFGEAAFYPLMTLLFATGLVGFMAFVLLPKLLPIFAGFGLELPWPTRVIVWFAKIWPWLVFGLLVVALGVYFCFREQDRRRAFSHSLPLVGEALFERDLGEISASLSILVSSGAALDSSFKLLAEQAENPSIQESMLLLRTNLRRGLSLDEALEADESLPLLWPQLLVVGSETGRIDYFADRLADIYLDNFQWRLEQATNLLEPLMLMVLGGLVGFVLMACFLPFYGLLNLAV